MGTTYELLNLTKREYVLTAEKYPQVFFCDGAKALAYLGMDAGRDDRVCGRWCGDQVMVAAEHNPLVDERYKEGTDWVDITSLVKTEWNKEFPEAPINLFEYEDDEPGIT